MIEQFYLIHKLSPNTYYHSRSDLVINGNEEVLHIS